MKHGSIKHLVSVLANDYPQFQFKEAQDFSYQSSSRTISYNPLTNSAETLLLHELAHALLNHIDYHFDIELLKMETDAWHYAKTVLAPKYKLKLDLGLVDETLETYRNWIFERSSCPKCGSVGHQKKDNTYTCLECGTVWKVNAAKLVALRRYKIK